VSGRKERREGRKERGKQWRMQDLRRGFQIARVKNLEVTPKVTPIFA
jgi:hypothetical protein